MTLEEALRLVQQRTQTDRRNLFLACGFEPLHLATFLKGHFLRRFPEEAVQVKTGVYGDLEGSLGMAAASEAEAAIAVLEWSSLDPRLGLRSAGGWSLSVQTAILENCRERFSALLQALEELGSRMPVALVPPTLPITLAGHTPGWHWSANELQLQAQLTTFLLAACRLRGIRVTNPGYLTRISPEANRLDETMELRAGFPYTIPHASAVAGQAIQTLFPPSPMKGLITDLDETLWRGIVGEVGISGVSWSLSDHAQAHGLYQQMLQHLSEMGVLIAAASKNDANVVDGALQREDLLLPAKSLFPVYANWAAKSASVAEILRVWNIGPESVVFVDDSPMELAEVKAAFPDMTCLQFSSQPAKTLELLVTLRDLFGKASINDEDAIRAASIRANAHFDAAAAASGSREFMHSLGGKVTIESRKSALTPRFLELINKTNQFNLNGVRLTEGEWMRQIGDPDGIVIGVSYEDKFGPLGLISVLAGTRAGDRVNVTTWVLSCRAFSRQIEHHTLQHLFQHYQTEQISFSYRGTARNDLTLRFLEESGAVASNPGALVLSREAFLERQQDFPLGVVVRDDPAPCPTHTL